MKILIIGNAYSGFNLGFTSHLKLLDSQAEVDILNYYLERDSNKREINDSPYSHIYHYYSDIPPIIASVPVVRGFYSKLEALRNLKQVKKRVNEYDVVLIQGFWERSCRILFELINSHTFVIGAFWGSDFYKAHHLKRLQEAVDRCDKIIISTKSMEQDVQKTLQIRNDKIANCLFGVQPMEVIFQLSHVGKTFSKKKLDINENSKVITCGYNGKIYQQHLEIISQLVIIKDRLIGEKVFLVFPMSYGLNPAYLSKIEFSLELLGVDYKIITDFLSNENVAYLRKATDIFVQLQTTDANSGSMREHLCCQNIVVTGSWLPYDHLVDEGIFFETIDSVGELSKKLIHIFDNYSSLERQAGKINSPDKFRKSLWSETIKDWYEVLISYKEYNHGN